MFNNVKSFTEFSSSKVGGTSLIIFKVEVDSVMVTQDSQYERKWIDGKVLRLRIN